MEQIGTSLNPYPVNRRDQHDGFTNPLDVTDTITLSTAEIEVSDSDESPSGSPDYSKNQQSSFHSLAKQIAKNIDMAQHSPSLSLGHRTHPLSSNAIHGTHHQYTNLLPSSATKRSQSVPLYVDGRERRGSTTSQRSAVSTPTTISHTLSRGNPVIPPTTQIAAYQLPVSDAAPTTIRANPSRQKVKKKNDHFLNLAEKRTAENPRLSFNLFKSNKVPE